MCVSIRLLKRLELANYRQCSPNRLNFQILAAAYVLAKDKREARPLHSAVLSSVDPITEYFFASS